MKIRKFKNSKIQKFENSKIPLKGSRMLIKLKTTTFRLAVSKMDQFKFAKMDQFKKAIKDNDTDKVLELEQEFNLHLKLALFHAIKENEEAAIDMIENGQSLALSLSQTNEEKINALTLKACRFKPSEDITTNFGSGILDNNMNK